MHQITGKAESVSGGALRREPALPRRHMAGRLPSCRLGAIVAICMVVLAGCKLIVSYHPILLPIEISVSSDGSIDVSASADFATPIGDFSVSAPLVSYRIPPSETLLVIRRLVHLVAGVAAYGDASTPRVRLLGQETAGGQDADASGTWITKNYLVVMKTAHKLRFLVNGQFHLESSHGNIAILSISRGVTGIRVDDVQGDSAAPRFSAVHVSTLPNPKLTTPPPSPPPASSPASTSTPTGTTSKTPAGTPILVSPSSSPSPSPTATSSSPPPISSSELIAARGSHG